MSVKVFSSLSTSSKTYYVEEKDYQVKGKLQFKVTKSKSIIILMEKKIINKVIVLHKDKSEECSKISF